MAAWLTLLFCSGLALADEPSPPATPDAQAHVDDDPGQSLAQTAYLVGLGAWKHREYDTALAKAREALAIDPTLAPARLLEAYALLRLDQVDAGVARLQSLATDAPDTVADGEVQRRARILSRRITDRWRRDQWSLSLGHTLGLETVYQGVDLTAGPMFMVEAPLPKRLGVRADVQIEWATGNDTFDFGGPSGALLATWHQPIARGVWSVDLAVGPSLWWGIGGYWPEGYRPYLGGRAAAGLDVRFDRRMGMRAEVGTRYYPTVTRTLPWYSQPVDSRISMIWWLGK